MSKLQAFNKYILTRKVKIILALFAIFAAVFYFFTSVNLAVSMFFAFVVMGGLLIILLAIPSKKARIFYNFYSD
jgi:uncharacterized YccA/Bax inhibitor family protein